MGEEPVGNHAQRERLDGRLGFSLSRTVGHDSRKFGNPASIVFALKFNLKVHAASAIPEQPSPWRDAEHVPSAVLPT